MSENGKSRNGWGDAHENEMTAHFGDSPVATFERDLRAAFLRPSSAELAERHLEAMLAESRRTRARSTRRELPTTRDSWRARSPALALRLAALALALFVLTAGLALAGVRPPEPIADALESIGVDIPGDDTAPGIGALEKADDPIDMPDGGGLTDRRAGRRSSRTGGSADTGSPKSPGRPADPRSRANPGRSADAGRPASPGNFRSAGPPASSGPPAHSSAPPEAGPPPHSSASPEAGPPPIAGSSSAQPPASAGHGPP